MNLQSIMLHTVPLKSLLAVISPFASWALRGWSRISLIFGMLFCWHPAVRSALPFAMFGLQSSGQDFFTSQNKAGAAAEVPHCK